MKHQIVNDLKSILEQFEKNKNLFEIFRDVIEICSISEHQAVFNLGFVAKNADYELLEQKYLEIVGKYKKSDVDLIVKFYAHLKAFFLEGNHADILGELYMQLEISNKRIGQFFTPYTVSQFMAEINLLNIEDEIKEKGYFTLSDPCVGAGCMIIAVSDTLRRKNINSGQMLFQVVDIDRLCFNMCYVQLSMLRLNGVVIWGDSLACQVYETRKTPALILNDDKADKNTKELIKNLEILQATQTQKSDPEEKEVKPKVVEQLTLF
jgi:type I restriction-modification system DNA methylase subunit